MTDKKATSPRPALNKARALQAAVALADRDGLGALTMRRLGAELGFEAMALYKHIADKEELLNGMVELVISEIEIPDEGADWKEAMRRRATSARKVLTRHSWAIGLLESGASTGPSTFRYLNAIIGNLRSAGFSLENAAHAFWLLDSYVYGQVIQESNLAFNTSEQMTETAASTLELVSPADFPHLVAMYEDALVADYSVDTEFEFGLELILSGLEELRAT